MNTYLLSLYFLFIAALSQALIGGLALKSSLQRDLPRERWRRTGISRRPTDRP